MASNETSPKVRLKVSPEVARIVAADASGELRMDAARGVLPLNARDLVTVLLVFCHGLAPDLKAQAQQTLRRLPAAVLLPVLEAGGLPPRFLDALARLRPDDASLVRFLLKAGALSEATLIDLASHGCGKVLNVLAENAALLERPALRQAMGRNPQADQALLALLGGETQASSAAPAVVPPVPAETAKPDVEDASEAEEESPEEELNASKYQQSMDMVVAEKIKFALTGDKEWRSIFLRDANKLVSTAVLKNPRITEGEVLTVAKNHSTPDELIRLITLNREWVKSYEIRRALVMHPRTPLPKALRYMSTLGDRDIKTLAKSRNVSPVIVNNARRILMVKEKGK